MDKKEIKERFTNMQAARREIVKETGGKRRVAGQIVCPICKSGELGFEVASNGHIWAKCSTVGCVQWIE